MNPNDFINAFLEELDEQLIEMEQKILELERQGDKDSTIQDLFRVAHTLKGSSAAMGFVEMKELTHEMEQVLDEVRNHRFDITESLIDLLFKCYDGLKELQEQFSSGDAIKADILPLVSGLNAFIKQQNNVSIDDPIYSENDASDYLTSTHFDELIEGAKHGLRILDITIKFKEDAVLKIPRSMVIATHLENLGEIVQCFPSLEEMEEIEGDSLEEFKLLLLTQWSDKEIYDSVSSSELSEVLIMEIMQEDIIQLRSDIHDEPQEIVKETITERQEVADSPSIKKSKSIRVDVERLETLMNLVGELVIDQARIDQVQGALSRRYKSDEQVRTLSDISAHISRIVSELQENVMTARMLPIESLFDRFPRIIRDLSHALNKEVDLVIDGRDTRLDRTVIEEIADPLIHLIRNALDHGIEAPVQRTKIGKSTKGKLTLSAAHEDNKVVITVQDDGAGINPNKMRELGVEKGMITRSEAEKMNDIEAVHLIFRPAFSTAEMVSDISGRGVGMDIVRSHIEKLNGTIDIQTELGLGTIFRIKLPLTLAIIPGLLVGINERTFVVPMNNVAEIVRVTPESIQNIKGKPTILLRGQVTPVISLNHFFGLPAERDKRKYFPLVVVETAEKRVAMVVDELHGNQEIVKKSLGHHAGSARGVAGATILGNGEVGLILDIASICKEAIFQ